MEGKSIYARIQQSRVDVQGEIKKATSGYGYNYFSNDDILPIANEVLNRNGLCPLFRIEKRSSGVETVTSTHSDGTETETIKSTYDEFWGILDIVSADGNEKVTYEIPTCLASIKGATAIQNFGAMQTFCKRYLYLSFLEIADGSDKEVERDADEEKKSKGTKLTEQQKKKILEKTSDDDLKEIMKFFNVSSIDEMTVKQASECLKRLS